MILLLEDNQLEQHRDTKGSEFVDVTGRRRQLSMGEAPLEDLVQVLVVAEVEAGLGHRLAARQHDLVQPHDVLSQQRDNSLLSKIAGAVTLRQCKKMLNESWPIPFGLRNLNLVACSILMLLLYSRGYSKAR